MTPASSAPPPSPSNVSVSTAGRNRRRGRLAGTTKCIAGLRRTIRPRSDRNAVSPYERDPPSPLQPPRRDGRAPNCRDGLARDNAGINGAVAHVARPAAHGNPNRPAYRPALPLPVPTTRPLPLPTLAPLPTVPSLPRF